jgi:hypothetical protein
MNTMIPANLQQITAQTIWCTPMQKNRVIRRNIAEKEEKNNKIKQ